VQQLNKRKQESLASLTSIFEDYTSMLQDKQSQRKHASYMRQLDRAHVRQRRRLSCALVQQQRLCAATASRRRPCAVGDKEDVIFKIVPHESL
jgi:hypothetical protein